MMKKIISLALVLVLCACACVNVFASEDRESTIIIGDTEVTFDEASSLTNEQKQMIAETMAYGKSDAQTYGLMCTLFGHKTTTEIVYTTTHGVNSTAPRCLEEIWELEICTRCETLINQTVLSYCYVYCCD